MTRVPVQATSRTFVAELDAASGILRSPRSPITDPEMSGAVADMLDGEATACTWRAGGQPGSAYIRVARAVAVSVFRAEASRG